LDRQSRISLMKHGSLSLHAGRPGTPGRQTSSEEHWNTEAQRNVLVRLVLRPVDRTLTDAEANALRDEVYEAIHQGSRGQWAAQ